MAVRHAEPAEAVDVGPMGATFSTARTHTLIKSAELEVIRLVMPAGKKLLPHRVAGEITVHCLEGRVNLTADGARRELTAGSLLYLQGGSEHALEAVENASLLVTILLTAGDGPRTPTPWRE